MTLEKISAQDPTHWMLMPAILDRIRDFCTKYPTDLDAQWCVDLTKAHFITGSDQVGLWAALDGDDVVGHILTVAEMRPGNRLVAFVLQVQCDRRVPREWWTDAPEAVRQWARSLNAVSIETTTWLQPKTLERYGFAPYRTVARMEMAHGRQQ